MNLICAHDMYTYGYIQVIISFRGTEQVKFKDILTDINMMMDSYENTNEILSKITVHKGFMDAFRSVRGALLQVSDHIRIYKKNYLSYYTSLASYTAPASSPPPHAVCPSTPYLSHKIYTYYVSYPHSWTPFGRSEGRCCK